MTRVRAVGWLNGMVEALLAALLLFLPAALGTVDAWSEAIAIGVGGAIAVCLATRIVIDPPEIPRLPAAIVMVFLAVAAFGLVRLPRDVVTALSPATANTKLDLLGDLPDAAETLDRMTLTFYPWATRHDLRVVLLASIVLAAVVIVFRDDDRRTRRLLGTVALIGAATALLALAQDATGTQKIYWSQDIGFPALGGPFVNHSHFGQMMNLCIGAALGLLLLRLNEEDGGDRRRQRRRVVWLGAMIVMGLLSVCLSLTRGGVIGMLVAGALTLLVLLSAKSLRWLGPVVIVLGLLLLVALLTYGFDTVYERMADPRGLLGRLQMVQDTRAIIRQFPVTGVGLGTFEWVYPAYNHTDQANTAGYLENEYVQSAAEMGIGGLVLIFLFVATVWRSYARAARGGGIGLAAVGLGYGLAAVMVHSLTDFGQHLPSVACYSAVTCGLLLNLGQARPPRISRFAAGIAAIVLIGVAAWMIVGAEAARRGEAQWTMARRLARRMEQRHWHGTDGQFAELLSAADAAVAAEPDQAHRRYWTAYYYWKDVRRRRDPQTGRIPITDQNVGDALRVIGRLNEARKLCPTDAAIYAVLGQVEYNFLGRGVGVTHFHTAARLDSNDPILCYLSGEVDARRGKDDSAVPMLRRAVDLDRNEMQDVLDLAVDELHRPELAIRVAETDWFRMMQVAMQLQPMPQYADLWDRLYNRAVDMLEERCAHDANVDPSWFAALASYRMSRKQYAKAEIYFAKALPLDPSNVNLRVEHARALAHLGRYDEALRETRTAQRMFPDSPLVKRMIDWLTSPTPAPEP